MEDQSFDEEFLFGQLDATNPFSGILGVPSTNQAQADDANGQFIRHSSIWEQDLSLNGFEASGLQSGDFQPEGFNLGLFNIHDNNFAKGYVGGQGIQALHQGDFLTIPNTNNGRHRGMNPLGGYQYRHNLGNASLHEADRPVMYRTPSGYGSTEFMLDAQQICAFDDNFRSGNDLSIQSPPFAYQFTSADLGTLSQCPDADDAVSVACSQASCDSKCTSHVCEDENCSVTGIPCDDPNCVDNLSPAQLLCPAHQAPTSPTSTPVPFHQTHSQPCNHTESEHLVARTLGELRAPAEPDTLEKVPYAINFGTALTSRVGEEFDHESYQPYSSPRLPTELENFGSKHPPTPIPAVPSITITPTGEHICQWTDLDIQGEKGICGAVFTNTKDIHDHLCEHIDKLMSQAGYACLWAGCSREGQRPFVTRGKLRRHISTHSVYKPFTCGVCKQGFSGQQALQQHERIHTGQKPYKCTVEGCNMAFKQKSALTMHSRVHTGEKPLKCDICGKAFPESSNLSKHKKTHWAVSDKYTCEEIVKGKPCGRSFRRLDQLRRHRQTHLNPERRRSGHNRSISVVSTTSGELSSMTQPATTPSSAS
ncbi:hypothetical protein F5Y01DRAFT_267577 [Xylaria sp. FL0043]|nr:hypothetical protein F5Y01DRAFT_267577 [Xylaria sp. FL0043]